VVYATTLVPEGWRWLIWLNPMTLVTESLRAILIGGQSPSLIALGGLLVWTVAAQVVGWRLFAKMNPRLAELV